VEVFAVLSASWVLLDSGDYHSEEKEAAYASFISFIEVPLLQKTLQHKHKILHLRIALQCRFCELHPFKPVLLVESDINEHPLNLRF
jgi:hypothetical protein